MKTTFLRSSLLVVFVAITFSGKGTGAATTDKPDLSSDKILEVLPLTPAAVNTKGDLVLQFKDGGTFLFWSKSTGKQTVLYDVSMVGTSGYPSRLQINENTDQALFWRLDPKKSTYLFDLVGFGTGEPVSQIIPETRYANFLPRLSPGGDSYIFSGSTGAWGAGTTGLWLFRLNEYLYDVEQGQAQPTGFYIEKVVVDELKSDPRGGRRVTAMDVAWSPTANEVALLYQNASFLTAVGVYNFDKKEFTELGTLQSGMNLDWPKGDYIYYSAYNNIGSYSLFRFDRSKAVSESVSSDPIDSGSYRISSDGKWALYAVFSNTAKTPSAGLVNLSTKAIYKIAGCGGGAFSADNLSVALQRDVKDPKGTELPVRTVLISDLVAAAKDGKIDLAKITTGKDAGQPFYSYEPPSDAGKFKERFELSAPVVSHAGTSIWAYNYLKNKTDRYYTFKFPGWEYAKCTLKDDTGTVVAESAKSSAPEPTRMLVGPEKSANLYCSLFWSTPVASGTKGTLTFEVLGYPGSAIEQEFVF